MPEGARGTAGGEEKLGVENQGEVAWIEIRLGGGVLFILQPFLSRLVALLSCRLPESAISCPFSSTSPGSGSGVLTLYSLHQDPTTTHPPSQPATDPASQRSANPPRPVSEREARPPLPPSSLRGVQSSPVPTPDSRLPGCVCIVLLLQHLHLLRLSWLGASQILPLPQPNLP